MRLFILWYKDIPPTRNLAFYKRIEHLSKRSQVILLTRYSSQVDELLSARLQIVRGPREISLPIWIPGLLRRNIGMWWNYFRYSYWALNFILKQGDPVYDVVYTFQNFEAKIGWQSKRKGFVWVADVLDMPDLYLEYPKRFRRSGKMLRAILLELLFSKVFLMEKIFREADLVFAIGPTISEGCAAKMIQKYQVPSNKIYPTINGVDLERVVPKSPKSDWGHDRTLLHLCYVGRLSPDRGVSTALVALALLRQMNILAILHLVGEVSRDYRDKLPKEVHQLGLDEQVLFHGFLEHQEALAVIQSADICLYPFPHSPVLDPVVPIKVLEYLALGKAVVATDLPGVRHIIRDREHGLLIPPENAEALAAAIQELSCDRNLRRTLEENARSSILSYDWNHINELIFQEICRLHESRIRFGTTSTQQESQGLIVG